jgi:hypothetical protein
MARPPVADVGDSLQMWRVVANILNEQPQTADKGWSSCLVLGEGLTTPHRKEPTYYEMLHGVSNLDGFFATTLAMENGYEVWNMECYESL